jgi:hypothetical protein
MGNNIRRTGLLRENSPSPAHIWQQEEERRRLKTPLECPRMKNTVRDARIYAGTGFTARVFCPMGCGNRSSSAIDLSAGGKAFCAVSEIYGSGGLERLSTAKPE